MKLVFKMAKNLLETDTTDEDIYNAKIKLASELVNYDKVKNNDQIKALVDFLEYLFLIENPELEKKYEAYKNTNGGVLKMSIDEIRKLHYKEEGREEGIEKGREEGIEKGIEQLILKQFKKGLSMEYIAEINELDLEYVKGVVTKNK